ncbi:Lipase maturation factor 1 [Sciurus carolinensis]|nr:Lipase maturation factor 1 [Sciurus carolinensis]
MAAPEGSLRRRKAGDSDLGSGSPPAPGRDDASCSARLRAGTFWLTRIVLLRALAFVYSVAFLVALHQNKQLIGDRGLLPCRAYLKSVQHYFQGQGAWGAWSYAPTVIWLLDWSDMDFNLDLLAVLGLGISCFVLMTGCANMILMAALWGLYLSLVNVGQVWYSFGWESQLLETGFLGIFLCPWWTLSRLPRHTPTSRIVLWGFRWLIFRIMLGAGLVKIRGDQCWRDLTCLDFHYEATWKTNGRGCGKLPRGSLQTHDRAEWLCVDSVGTWAHTRPHCSQGSCRVATPGFTLPLWAARSPSSVGRAAGLGLTGPAGRASTRCWVGRRLARGQLSACPTSRRPCAKKSPRAPRPALFSGGGGSSEAADAPRWVPGRSAGRGGRGLRCGKRTVLPVPASFVLLVFFLSTRLGGGQQRRLLSGERVEAAPSGPGRDPAAAPLSPVLCRGPRPALQLLLGSQPAEPGRGPAPAGLWPRKPGTILLETQPVPSPLAYFLHRTPWWVHRFEVLGSHFLELLVPFFLFLGRRMCILHGVLQILFQVALILSGNVSFLNWLTIVPSLACFDDASLGFLFPSGPAGLKDRVLRLQDGEASGAQPQPRHVGRAVRSVVHLSLGILVACLSLPVVLNLLSAKQVMNATFSSLRIVNSYGAFGSITKERTEVILQGTASPNASAPGAVWEDYEFKCKPGDPWRRPCLLSPYHYRLDWLMWLAAFQTYEHNEWILHLAGKLLANDAQALSLLASSPFEGRAPPRWIRAEHWRYRFSLPGGRHAAEGKWWVRRRIGPYFPPLRLQDLEGYFRERSCLRAALATGPRALRLPTRHSPSLGRLPAAHSPSRGSAHAPTARPRPDWVTLISPGPPLPRESRLQMPSAAQSAPGRHPDPEGLPGSWTRAVPESRSQARRHGPGPGILQAAPMGLHRFGSSRHFALSRLREQSNELRHSAPPLPGSKMAVKPHPFLLRTEVISRSGSNDAGSGWPWLEVGRGFAFRPESGTFARRARPSRGSAQPDLVPACAAVRRDRGRRGVCGRRPGSGSGGSPRLATSEAPDAMEEWDVPQMKKEVESLKYQLAFKREMSSKTIPELLKWIEDGIPKDPFLNPDLMKNNPWVEKGKCAIL